MQNIQFCELLIIKKIFRRIQNLTLKRGSLSLWTLKQGLKILKTNSNSKKEEKISKKLSNPSGSTLRVFYTLEIIHFQIFSFPQ